MKPGLWYSITPHEANHLVNAGQKMVIDYMIHGYKVRGTVDRRELDFSVFGIYYSSEGKSEDGYWSCYLMQSIFKTNDRQVEIIVPGDVIVTIELE